MTILVQDTFIRANTSGSNTVGDPNGWGTASDGNSWTRQGPGTPSFGILSNVGETDLTTSDTFLLLSANTYAKAEATIRIVTGGGGMGATDWCGLLLRYADPTHFYACYLMFGGSNNFVITKANGGAQTTLVSATFAVATNVANRLRFQANGNNLYGKIWKASDVEPGPWTISTTDSALVSGRVGIYDRPNFMASVLHHDHFSVNDTQASGSPSGSGIIDSDASQTGTVW